MSTAKVISRELVGDVVVLVMDNPPVNTLGRPLRRALLAELESAENDPTVHGVVISGGRTFSAGADLAEFDSGEGLAEPTLHLTICGFLDSMTTPSVAAISGVALGGGLELALACSARVAHPAAKLGLPETTLGFMPGAGGTQRLPRAIGIEAATDLITTGRAIDAATAARLGLVAAVSDEPVTAAIELVRTLSGTNKPRLRDAPITEPLAVAFVDAARRAASRNPRASQGMRDALTALDAAVTLPFDSGLARELELFEHLAAQPEARAARYRFLSERAAGKVAGTATPIESAAVIGAGTMGRGIALSLLAAGLRTTIIDTDADRVEAGVAGISAELTRAVSRGRLDEDARTARLALLSSSVGLDGAIGVDLVIEAVFENMEVKKGVFEQLDAITGAGTILASNTSSLNLDELAAVTSRPAAVVGMHFFSPANVMRLVEVVDGEQTSDSVLATVTTLARRLGKLPVVAQVGPGFIGNRIFDAYLRQANQLVSAGVAPDRIDRVLESWGMAMGPFRVLDVVGNDVPALARTAAGINEPVWAIADLLVEKGWLGRKSGRGWYTYPEGGSASPNAELAEILAAIAAPDLELEDSEIVGRCVLAMTNELAAVVGDGIAASAADADTVIVNGYGFPAKQGGPWFFAGLQGYDRVARTMRRWRAKTGDSFWEPNELIDQEASR